jgi:hypothetical protein
LSKTLFDKLDVGATDQFLLKIRSLADPRAQIGINRYTVFVTAEVGNYNYSSTVSFFVDIEERDYESRIEFESDAQFADDMFQQHPECEKYADLIKQAKETFDTHGHAMAIPIIDSAIQACRDAIASAGEEKEKPSSDRATNLIILVAGIILLLLLLLAISTYYGKRRIRQEIMKQKISREESIKKLSKSEIELEFDGLTDKIQELINKKEIMRARITYRRLYSLYNTIQSSYLSNSVKISCYQKLSSIHSELSKLLKRFRK